MTDLARLSEPFSVSQIHWRVGSTTGDKKKGMALAYLDARDVEDRLDKVCGLSGWQSKHIMQSSGPKVQCSIGIKVPILGSGLVEVNVGQFKVDEEWIWKSDGAGETSYEGDKGSFSDAFKRAGVSWGIGRYLYSCPNWWAAIDGKKQFTDPSIKELNSKMDNWLLPGRKARYTEAYNKWRGNVDSMVDAMAASELGYANEMWKEIPESDQASLWLAVDKGGLFDQKTKAVIRSTEFMTARTKK